tara:strand:+ start:1038 stop:1604 length:567 start_codon:yes stop_codon:yes gene_type:complete
MKKINYYTITILIIVIQFLNFSSIGYEMNDKTIYEFKIQSLNGEILNLNKYTGKAILLVNVASKCGFTKQYNDLQKLWEKYNEKGLVVLGVPSNQFGGQEPGSDEDIKKFCEINFNINFPMSSKYDVKGDNALNIYKWAKNTYGKKAVPKWNFHKILIDKNGVIVDTFASFTNPMSKKITSKIEEILN